MADRRLTPAARFSAAGGLVLLGGLFVKWYAANGVAVSGWHAVHVLRWLLLVTGLAAIGAAAARVAGRQGDLPVSPTAVLSVLGSLSSALIVLRWLDHPHPHLSVRIGLFVAVLGAVMITVGARQAVAEAGAGGSAP